MDRDRYTIINKVTIESSEYRQLIEDLTNAKRDSELYKSMHDAECERFARLQRNYDQLEHEYKVMSDNNDLYERYINRWGGNKDFLEWVQEQKGGVTE